MTSINYPNEVECVLISDEEDDEATTALTTKGLANNIKMASNHSSDNKDTNSTERIAVIGYDDSDGRRVSRRRKNKAEYFEVARSGEQQQRTGINSDENSVNSKSSTTNQITTTIPKDDKKFNVENRAETRSRKRERSGSPQTVETKEVDPIPYKEILSGLEGAAFQSR